MCCRRSGRRELIGLLESLPALLESQLPGMHDKARELSRKYAQARNFFYLGGGIASPWPWKAPSSSRNCSTSTPKAMPPVK